MSEEKTKSLFMLVGWLIFIVILIIFIRIGYKNNSNVTIDSGLNFIRLEDGFIELIRSTYVYNYNIIDNGNIINYTGSVNKNINNGIKITNDSTINYYSDGIYYYNKDTNEIISIYDNYLSYFLIPANVYNFIYELNYDTKIDSNKKVYIYNSTYNNLPIEIYVFVNENNITDINYKYNNIEYNCNYSNINLVN